MPKIKSILQGLISFFIFFLIFLGLMFMSGGRMPSTLDLMILAWPWAIFSNSTNALQFSILINSFLLAFFGIFVSHKAQNNHTLKMFKYPLLVVIPLLLGMIGLIYNLMKSPM